MVSKPKKYIYNEIQNKPGFENLIYTMKQNPAGYPYLLIPICNPFIFPALLNNSKIESSLVPIDKFPMYTVQVVYSFF